VLVLILRVPDAALLSAPPVTSASNRVRLYGQLKPRTLDETPRIAVDLHRHGHDAEFKLEAIGSRAGGKKQGGTSDACALDGAGES
jgi:hypothetical protein